ncbi:hypothetical protein [Lentibacillus cibarius]|uniref:hypothetical protein n=1 Tax=Lentibacillus cibarius TaxID=2583219 RepID=UPI001487269A|nr:hypothetical protein [Lentibacillus cibarius]
MEKSGEPVDLSPWFQDYQRISSEHHRMRQDYQRISGAHQRKGAGYQRISS